MKKIPLNKYTLYFKNNVIKKEFELHYFKQKDF